MTSFSDLPVELKEEILSYLPPKELGANAVLVSKEWLLLATSEPLWRGCFQRHFPGDLPTPVNGWRSLFKDMNQKMKDFCWEYAEENITVKGLTCSVPNGVGPWKSAATRISFTSGVHYWEIKVLKWVPKAYVVSLQIGVINGALCARREMETDCLGWIGGRPLNYSPSLYPGPGTYMQGDVIGVLLCLDGPTRWIGYYKNGAFFAPGYVVPLDWDRVHPAVALDDGSEVELIPYAIPPYPLPAPPTIPEAPVEDDMEETNYLNRVFAEMRFASQYPSTDAELLGDPASNSSDDSASEEENETPHDHTHDHEHDDKQGHDDHHEHEGH